MTYFKSLMIGSALCALLAPSAMAQDTQNETNDADEIIVTGLRAVDAKDVTASVTVIDTQDLAIRNSPYVADQLRAVPSLAVSRSGAAGGLTQIRLRGSEGNHTLVLLNGIEVSNPVTGETDFGLWSGLTSARIEVARGEQSGLYGSDAIGGVIAITTKTDALNAAAEYGAFDTFRGQAGLGFDVEAASFGLSLSAFETEGVDTSGLSGEKDGSSAYSVLANTAITLSPDWHIGALASYRRSSVAFDSDTDFDGALNNTDQDAVADQVIVGANLSGQTGALSHLVSANYTDVSTVSDTNGVFANETIGQRTKLSYSPSLTVDLGAASLAFSALADWEDETYQRIDTNTLFGDPNQSQSFESFGVAGEARAAIGSAALNGSLRRDDNNGRFEDATTWRVGAAYNFDFGGKLRASTGTGVKNPTFTELFGFFPGSFIGNPDLIPEKSNSWEVGYEQTLGTFHAAFTYFDAKLQNEITTRFNPDFSSSPANIAGDSTRSGVELSVDWAFSDSLSLMGTLSNISAKDSSGEDEIRRPKTTGSLAANWQSTRKEGLRVGLAADYVGAQDDFNFGAFPAQRVTLSDYVLVSANIAYPITDRFAVTLRGENLLDEKVQDLFSYNNTGAGVFIGFTLK